jgi:hypothetical protein
LPRLSRLVRKASLLFVAAGETMKLGAIASSIHKWLALIVGVQILFWFASGLFFALYPIERVRSEHRIAEHAHAALTTESLRAPAEIAALLPEAPTRLTYERTPAGDEVALAEFAGRRPILIDLEDWRVPSPLSAGAAEPIAQTYVAGAPRVRDVRLVTEESPEYRGVLPAWRVAFDDAEGLAVYVAADTAHVTARAPIFGGSTMRCGRCTSWTGATTRISTRGC